MTKRASRTRSAPAVPAESEYEVVRELTPRQHEIITARFREMVGAMAASERASDGFREGCEMLTGGDPDLRVNVKDGTIVRVPADRATPPPPEE